MVTAAKGARQVNLIDQQHSWFIIFLLGQEDVRSVPNVHCVGCRELVILDYEEPAHIRGVIEFNGVYIPVIDPRILLFGLPTKFNNLSCILVVPHRWGHQQFYAGIIIEDIDEIIEYASGEPDVGPLKDISVNIRFVLDMRKNPGAESCLYENQQEQDYITFERICSEKTLSR